MSVTPEQERVETTANINLPIKLLKTLKHGKRVLIPNLDKRYAMIGMLEAFGIKVTRHGAFISLIQEDGESNV